MTIHRTDAQSHAGLAPVGLAEDVYIHPLADVEEKAQIGAGTKIWRFTHVRSNVVIGENCMLGNNVYIDAGVQIGNGVRIQNGVSIYLGVILEDEVFVGPNATFTNDLYPRAINPNWVVSPTRLCIGAAIGANATIVCGVTIGAYAMVAAGSVVTRDVAPFSLVRGNPARHAGYMCACGQKLTETAYNDDGDHLGICGICGVVNNLTKGIVVR